MTPDKAVQEYLALERPAWKEYARIRDALKEELSFPLFLPEYYSRKREAWEEYLKIDRQAWDKYGEFMK